MLIAAAIAAPMIAASSAEAKIGIHIEGSGWGVWITIGKNNQSWSNVSPAGSAGHLDFNQPGPFAPMDFMFSPGTAGNPPLTGSTTDNMMGGYDLDLGAAPGGPGSVASARFGGIWVTGSGWGVHVIWGAQLQSPLFSLPYVGTEPDGTEHYAADSFFDVFFDVVNPSGGHTQEVRQGTHVEIFADRPLPAPGAAALLGMGGLLAARRRRR
jgi:hypothetical protein